MGLRNGGRNMSVLEGPQLGADSTLSRGDLVYEAEQGTISCQTLISQLCYIQLMGASIPAGLDHCWGFTAWAGLGEEGV